MKIYNMNYVDTQKIIFIINCDKLLYLLVAAYLNYYLNIIISYIGYI